MIGTRLENIIRSTEFNCGELSIVYNQWLKNDSNPLDRAELHARITELANLVDYLKSNQDSLETKI